MRTHDLDTIDHHVRSGRNRDRMRRLAIHHVAVCCRIVARLRREVHSVGLVRVRVLRNLADNAADRHRADSTILTTANAAVCIGVLRGGYTRHALGNCNATTVGTRAAANVGSFGSACSRRVERTVALDGESLANGNVDARIVLVKACDRVVPLEDNRRVATAGKTRPLAAGAVHAVDGRVAERHRRAVGDGHLDIRRERAGDDRTVRNRDVARQPRKIDLLAVVSVWVFGDFADDAADRHRADRATVTAADAAVCIGVLRGGHTRHALGDCDIPTVGTRTTPNVGSSGTAPSRYRAALDPDIAARYIVSAADARATSVAARIKRTVALDG